MSTRNSHPRALISFGILLCSNCSSEEEEEEEGGTIPLSECDPSTCSLFCPWTSTCTSLLLSPTYSSKEEEEGSKEVGRQGR